MDSAAVRVAHLEITGPLLQDATTCSRRRQIQQWLQQGRGCLSGANFDPNHARMQPLANTADRRLFGNDDWEQVLGKESARQTRTILRNALKRPGKVFVAYQAAARGCEVGVGSFGMSARLIGTQAIGVGEAAPCVC